MKTAILLVLFCVNADAHKFLLVFPLPIRSLSILSSSIANHLLDAGHEVTYITGFPLKTQHKNFRQIQVNNELGTDDVNITVVMENGGELGDLSGRGLHQWALHIAAEMFNNTDVRKLLQDPNERFDAVIAELYETEVYSALSAVFNCPMIWSHSMGPTWNVLELVSEASSPAYTADYLSSNVIPFTMRQRVQELWMQMYGYYIKRTEKRINDDTIYKNEIMPILIKRKKIAPTYEELVYNSSLILCNGHVSLDNVASLPGNVKLVGGYHIDSRSRAKPLPKELQDLMEQAKYGVIYFSMGSTWKSKTLPKPLISGLLEMFGKLKQTVIWKFEDDLPNKPRNVHVLKWAPQQSILAHPNCLLFITHGGLLSSTEAIHFGVPIVGVPIFFDQFVNINKAVAKGYALKVDLTYDLAENLWSASQLVLEDPKYKEKVKMLSFIYHHRVVPAGQQLVYWVEHVVETGGAAHLRSPSRMVPWYQKAYLDFLLICFTAFVVLLIGFRIVFRILFDKRRNANQKKKE